MMPRKVLPTLLLAVALPLWVAAAELVNINTADLASLETLNGIGPSKAQAIIDYRTQHGLFAAIEDIQNVSGIGPTTYANIKDFITVGDTQTAAQTQTQDQTQTATTTAPAQAQSQSSGGLGPPLISARITVELPSLVGAGTVFDATLFDASGGPLLSGGRFIWNFGDGSTGEGAHILHTFAYPGDYEVQVSAGYNYSSAIARVVVSAQPAQVALVAEGDGSLTLANLSAGDINAGWWSLNQGTSTFTIPDGTIVLAGKGLRFSPAVLGFAGSMAAQLYYPNGALAARAGAGANSPLRGQVVQLTKPMVGGGLRSDGDATSAALPAGKAAYPQTTVLSANAAAAATAPAANEAQWSYLLGLAAVITIGAVGAYYAHPPRRGLETTALADEFDIE